MKDINNFILEKLKLDKNIKLSKNKYEPTKEDYTKLISLFDNSFRKSGYSEYECEDLAKKCNNPTTCLRLWIGLQIMTNSTPYIYKSTIHSYPGNYGMPFIDRLIDKFDFDYKEILNEYESISDNEEKELPKALEEHYHRIIASLINYFPQNIRKDFKIKLKYFIPNGDNYSLKGKELLDTNKQMEVIPFEITYNGKNIICEISNRGSAYFHYRVNDKIFKLNADFIKELGKELILKK